MEPTDAACHEAMQWVTHLRAEGGTSVLQALLASSAPEPDRVARQRRDTSSQTLRRALPCAERRASPARGYPAGRWAAPFSSTSAAPLVCGGPRGLSVFMDQRVASGQTRLPWGQGALGFRGSWPAPRPEPDTPRALAEGVQSPRSGRAVPPDGREAGHEPQPRAE